METKKSPKSNLEKYRSIFVLVGLVLSLLMVFKVVNITKADVNVEILDSSTDNVDDEMIVVSTKPEDIEPPPPKEELNREIIEVVENSEVEIKNAFDDFIDPLDDTVVFENIWENEQIDVKKEEKPIMFPEKNPEFPGGEEALLAYIAKNIEYPQLAIDNDVEGTVYLRFVVTKTGKVTEVQVTKSIDPLLDAEAKRVVKSLPDFKPGMQGGRPVSVWHNIPIVFKIEK